MNRRSKSRITQIAFIFCFLAFVSFSEASFWENIPEFPQAKRIKQEEMAVNNNPVQVTTYSSLASLEEISEFYKKRFITIGWRLVSQMEPQGTKTLIFSKNFSFANVMIRESSGNSFITIVQGTLRKGSSKKDGFCPECEEKQASNISGAPSDDTPGRDLQFVPRYPATVRVNNVERGNGKKINLAYYTKDPVDKVVNFYLQNMGNYYWELKNEIDFRDLPEQVSEKINVELKGKSLVFKSDIASCIITVTEDPQNKGTIIGVSYNEK